MEPEGLSEVHIAPCGMNCALCVGFQREKRKCMGCNIIDENKPGYCKTCSVVTCMKRSDDLCFDCPDLPCRRIKQLDKRYSSKYHMSMMDNLSFIRENGLEAFLQNERKRWKCRECGHLVSVHRDHCVNCGKEIRWK
jgi:hypothetical protein